VEKGDLQTITEHRHVVSHFSQPWNLYILFNIHKFSSLCNRVNSKQRCSCEHNDDMRETGGSSFMHSLPSH